MVIAVARANARAAWPLGIPPFSGVPVEVKAFTTTTQINTNTIHIKVTCGSDFLIVKINEFDKSVNLS